MAAELVNLATSEKLKETDWAKCIEICELVNRDQGLAKDVIKAIKKRLGHKNPHTQIYAVTLLEMLMNNCGEHIHRQVIDSGLLPKMVKIVKKKSDLPVREKIFLLLDATQTSLGGASGKFPQYYAAYYDLVFANGGILELHPFAFWGSKASVGIVPLSFRVQPNTWGHQPNNSMLAEFSAIRELGCARVKFPQCSAVNPQNLPTPKPRQNNLPARTSVSPKCEGLAQQSTHQSMPESSIIHKASSALEVLRQVLDALDPQHPEDAANEFTLDLVEQCSFQKQRVMHLVMTSQDEMVVSQAIELNEQLQKVLAKHDALLSIRTTSRTAALNREEAEEEEEADSLFRRVRKGKACARAGDEDGSGSSSSSLDQAMGEKLLRPQVFRPIRLEPLEPRALPAGVVIPPPPAKHRERERFFKEKGVAGQMNGLSLHSRTGSSSHTGSTESSE